ALSDALAVIGEPGARFLDHARFHAEIDELAALRHAFSVHDVELDLLERRRGLFLDHLDAGLVADHLVAFLYPAAPAAPMAPGAVCCRGGRRGRHGPRSRRWGSRVSRT